MKEHFRKTVLILTTFLFCYYPCQPNPIYAGQNNTVSQLVSQGGYALVQNGRVTVAKNSKSPFVPASTIKIITSLATLDILGADYRFPTRMFRDKEGNLYIQGSDDPFLLTENITTIVRQLRDSGIEQINTLIVDESAFALDSLTEGCDNTTNPYDAWNSGLAVNFNAIAIRVAPDHTITADDPKVPFLPMMQAIGATLPLGAAS